MDNNIGEGESLELSGNSKKLGVARWRGSGEQYLRMGLESKVKDRSWKALWTKLREENHLDLRGKQCKG